MTDCRVIRATAAEYPAMAEIWQVCFGDDPSYIRFFFRSRLPSCIALAAQTEEKTAGGVYLLPAVLCDDGRQRPAYYIYALGVSPEYRGRGIATAMMQHIFGICKGQDAACFLKPASPSLADFYKRLGMRQTHYSAVYRYAASDGRHLPWTPFSAADYARLRLDVPYRDGSIIWDADAIRYAVDENKLCGGFCLRCEVNGNPCAVLGRREEDHLCITDFLGTDPEAVLPSLCAYLGAREARLRVPCSARDAQASPLVMTYGMNIPASGPCGLLLD